MCGLKPTPTSEAKATTTAKAKGLSKGPGLKPTPTSEAKATTTAKAKGLSKGPGLKPVFFIALVPMAEAVGLIPKSRRYCEYDFTCGWDVI